MIINILLELLGFAMVEFGPIAQVPGIHDDVVSELSGDEARRTITSKWMVFYFDLSTSMLSSQFMLMCFMMRRLIELLPALILLICNVRASLLKRNGIF